MKGRIQNQKSKIDLPQEVTEEVRRDQSQKKQLNRRDSSSPRRERRGNIGTVRKNKALGQPEKIRRAAQNGDRFCTSVSNT